MALRPKSERRYMYAFYWAPLSDEDAEIVMRIRHEWINQDGPPRMDEMEELRLSGHSPAMRVLVTQLDLEEN